MAPPEMTADPRPAESGWQQRVTQSLSVTGLDVAVALGCPKTTRELTVGLVKEAPQHLSCRLNIGSRSGFYKQFDDGDKPESAYCRERDSLRALNHTTLVPRLLAYSDRYRWILTEDFGPPVPLPAPTVQGRQAGEWVADLEAAAPSERASGNWNSYLHKLGLGAALKAMPGACETLSKIPLCGLVLTRNDAALHNFLHHPSGRMVGCDFENATLRPRGWEFVSVWAALVERFTDDADAVLTAYADGFAKNHRGGLIVEELSAVARILACARLGTGSPGSKSGRQHDG